MKKITACVALVLSVAGAGIAFAPAAAAGTGADCPNTYFCLYASTNLNGPINGMSFKEKGLGSPVYPAMNDKALSIYNNTPYSHLIIEHSDGRGAVDAVNPGAKLGNLTLVGWGLRISSVMRAS
ncbi:MAG: peptidase inhibitor family I36 protein [Pseudoclavibacter sp.]